MTQHPSESVPTESTPPPAKPKRSWRLYYLIAFLCSVIMLQTSYIVLSKNPAMQQVASAYTQMSSPEYLRELQGLLDTLNQPVTGLDPCASLAPADPASPGSSADPKQAPAQPNSKSQRPSPNVPGALDMDINELLDSLLSFGDIYGDTFDMLEDDPIIPQEPNAPGAAEKPSPPPVTRQVPTPENDEKPKDDVAVASPLTHTVSETADEFRIEVGTAQLDNYTVECAGNTILIRAKRVIMAKEWPFVHEIPLSAPVDCASMDVVMEDTRLLITIAKASSLPVAVG